jgi:hypothetical protein
VSFKVPVCRRREYTIFLQDIDGTTWAHCDVREWSGSVAKRLRADVDTLVEMQGAPVFAMNEPVGDVKHQKFLALMGFQFFKNLPALQGGEVPVYRRE